MQTTQVTGALSFPLRSQLFLGGGNADAARFLAEWLPGNQELIDYNAQDKCCVGVLGGVFGLGHVGSWGVSRLLMTQSATRNR
jgi:hypothetical protein